MRKLLKIFVVGGGILFIDIAQAGVTDIKLAPHRAVYEISLGHTSVGGSVAAISGRMALEFVDSCDGYALNQRMLT